MFIAQFQMAVTMFEARDHYTLGHLQRVAEFAQQVGRETNFGSEMLDEPRLGGELHDIGKSEGPMKRPKFSLWASVTALRTSVIHLAPSKPSERWSDIPQ